MRGLGGFGEGEEVAVHAEVPAVKRGGRDDERSQRDSDRVEQDVEDVENPHAEDVLRALHDHSEHRSANGGFPH